MVQSADEIIDDLRKFVAGRGRDDNFFYSKVYSPSSYIKCVDFSPWVRKRIMTNDIFALAVFAAKPGWKKNSFSISMNFKLK